MKRIKRKAKKSCDIADLYMRLYNDKPYGENFTRKYNKMYFSGQKEEANLLLLLFKLTDNNGQVAIKGDEEDQLTILTQLFNSTFRDPTQYAITDDGKLP